MSETPGFAGQSPEVRRLMRELWSLREQVKGLQRAVTSPQMIYGSIDDGTIVEKSAGEVVARIGRQPDGTHGIVDYAGPTPPAPNAPAVDGGPGLLTVTWDGTLTNARPLDLARVEAYAAEGPFEYLEEADLLGSITGRDGGRLTVTRTPGTWHVALVAVSRAEKRSVISALAEVEVQEAGDSEAVERLAKAFHTDTRPPTVEDGEGRPEGAYWTMLDATGAEEARWRWAEGEWVDAPLSPDFIPEAYVDRLAANQGLIQQLLAHDVDVSGFLRLAGALYAEQETYGLELTAEGINMSSQGLVYLGDPFFIPARPGSLSAIRYNIIVSLPVPGGQGVRDSYLVIYDSRTGEIVREIHADSGHTLGMHHYFDVDNEWIWVGRNTPDPNFGPVDLVAYDLMGNQVATRPVPIAISTFAVSDSYIAVDGGLSGGTPVYDHSGNLLRTIPYSGGSRYSPTEYTIHGDVLYDRFGETITLTDIPTGNIVQEIQIPSGSGGTATRSGNEWILHVEQWATGVWYIVVVDLTTNTISEQMQVDLGGNKTMYGAARGWNDYFVATDQDGTFAIEKRDPFRDEQTQASIDTITGSVRFNNPILGGVTKTDVTAMNKLHASRGDSIEVLPRLYGQYGHNWFTSEAERDAMLPHAWEGTEAITRSPVTTVWRMGRNQQWVRVWSEEPVVGQRVGGSNQNVTAGAVTRYTGFSSNDIATGGVQLVGNYGLRVPDSGWYTASASIRFGVMTSTGQRQCRIVVNGNGRALGVADLDFQNGRVVDVATQLLLEANDVVEMQIYSQHDGSTATFGSFPLTTSLTLAKA